VATLLQSLRRHSGDALLGDAHIMHISGGYEQNKRSALYIADRMDLGVSAAACLADTIGQGPSRGPMIPRIIGMRSTLRLPPSGVP
jgi:hypothetical protein